MKSERTFNSEVTLFLARKKHTLGKELGGMNNSEAFASWRSRTLNLSYYAGCLRAKQQVSEIQHLA